MDGNSKEDDVAATLSDPQYKAGRKLIDNGRLEEAVNFFSGLLETRVAVLDGDEMNPALAPLYYEYGNSLLYNAEESGAVFGDAITEAEKKKATAIIEAQITGATHGDGNDGGAGPGLADEEEAPSPNQEAEEDLEIAWQNLEIARRIYSELTMNEGIRTAIAKVHLRLGDLNMVNGMYNEAAEEFEKCLAHRIVLPHLRESRGVADAYVRQAQALFYASTLEGADKDALVARSLEQYRLAAKIFESMLALLSKEQTLAPPLEASSGKENISKSEADSSADKGKGKEKSTNMDDGKESSSSGAAGSGGSEEELQDALDAIRETIDTMRSGKDMEALAEYKSGVASTTIGFGNSTSSSKPVAVSSSGDGGTTTVGFGGSDGVSMGPGNPGEGGSNGASSGFSSVRAGAGAAANVMVGRRKGRPVPKTSQNGVGDRSDGANGESNSSKKARVDG